MKELSLWLRLKDGITESLKQINTSVKSNFEAMKQSVLIFTGAFAAITATVFNAIKSFQQQEDAIATLNQALTNNGNYSKAASSDLQAYASELQKVTKYGDETILSASAMIANFSVAVFMLFLLVIKHHRLLLFVLGLLL